MFFSTDLPIKAHPVPPLRCCCPSIHDDMMARCHSPRWPGPLAWLGHQQPAAQSWGCAWWPRGCRTQPPPHCSMLPYWSDWQLLPAPVFLMPPQKYLLPWSSSCPGLPPAPSAPDHPSSAVTRQWRPSPVRARAHPPDPGQSLWTQPRPCLLRIFRSLPMLQTLQLPSKNTG